MIPSLLMVRVDRHHGRTVRLWLPLFLLWPLIPLLAAVIAGAGPVVARRYRVAPVGALRAAWQLAGGCRGTDIEVDSPEFTFRIRFI